MIKDKLLDLHELGGEIPPGHRSLSRAWQIAIWTSLAGALLIPILTFRILFPLVSDLPKWDQWYWATMWKEHFSGHSIWPVLLRPYNNHLMVIPELLCFGVGRLTAWDVRVEVAGCYVVALLCLLCLLSLVGYLDGRLLILGTPIAAFVFSISQYESFLTGMPVAHQIAQLATLVALSLLLVSPENMFFLAAASVLGIVATLSFGTGVLVWPLGLLCLVTASRRSPLWIAIWVGLGATCWGFQMAAAAHLRAPRLLRALRFFLVLVGRSVDGSPTIDPRKAAGLGALLLALFAVLAVSEYRRSENRIYNAAVMLGLLAIGEAMLIAASRSESGIRQAFSSHYVTATYLLVVSLLLQIVATSLRVSSRFPRMKPLATCLAALLIGAAIWLDVRTAQVQLPILRQWSRTWLQDDRDLISAIATDEQIKRSQYPRPYEVWRVMEMLSKYRLAAFARLSTRLPLGSVETVAGQICSTDSVVAIDGRKPWRIEGWASNSDLGGEVAVIETRLDGKKFGRSELGLKRPDIEAKFNSARFAEVGWRVDVEPDDLGPAGTHDLSVLVRTSAGATRMLLRRHVNVL